MNDHLLSIKNIDIFNDSFYGIWDVDDFRNIFTPALISAAAQMNWTNTAGMALGHFVSICR